VQAGLSPPAGGERRCVVTEEVMFRESPAGGDKPTLI